MFFKKQNNNNNKISDEIKNFYHSRFYLKKIFFFKGSDEILIQTELIEDSAFEIKPQTTITTK
ncbi:hypothetical protein DERP_006744, partial [Dermatophagoides pteronyssinus]